MEIRENVSYIFFFCSSCVLLHKGKCYNMNFRDFLITLRLHYCTSSTYKFTLTVREGVYLCVLCKVYPYVCI